MPDTGVINSPYDDYITKTPAIDGGMNVGITKEPGYKPRTESPNAPERPHRHSNLDGGANLEGPDTQSPDAIVKRVG